MVAAESPVAAEVGLAVLAEGGSAVDAAVATSLAVCVVHPSSCGIGGGGFMVLYDAGSKRSVALDYREQAPQASRADLYEESGRYVPERSRRGALAIGVPGEIAGLALAHERFGRLPWSRLVRPAAELARSGFTVDAHLARGLASERAAIESDPELRDLLFAGGSEPPREGQVLRMSNLAVTLDRIAEQGAKAFYEGDVAEAIVTTVRESGGVLSKTDLASYRPVWREPLTTKYRGATVYTMPPPSAGGTALILGLVTLSGYDVAALGPDSPTRWHLFAEVMKHAFADRARFAGDPAFDRPAPPPDGASLRNRISPIGTHGPDYYGSGPQQPGRVGTTHLSVIAPDGSAVACTTTINTSFGALLGARGAGVILNNELDDFSFPAANLFGLAPGTSNRIAPGKRPASSMTPTVAVRDSRAVAAVGGSGGPLIISATLEVLSNVLDFDMPPEAAVAAPRVHHQWQPDVLLVEPGVRELDRATLRRLGHQIREISGVAAVSLATAMPGRPAAGAGDPRKGGGARVLQGCEGAGSACK